MKQITLSLPIRISTFSVQFPNNVSTLSEHVLINYSPLSQNVVKTFHKVKSPFQMGIFYTFSLQLPTISQSQHFLNTFPIFSWHYFNTLKSQSPSPHKNAISCLFIVFVLKNTPGISLEQQCVRPDFYIDAETELLRFTLEFRSLHFLLSMSWIFLISSYLTNELARCFSYFQNVFQTTIERLSLDCFSN